MASEQNSMHLTVGDFFDAGKSPLSLSLEANPNHLGRVIEEAALNRPGLALAGFFKYFAHKRIQVIGLAETAYLKSLSEGERRRRIQQMLHCRIPALVISRNRHVLPEMLEAAVKLQVPILKTAMITGAFMNSATILLEKLTSPCVRVQGTMVDIMGIGVLLEGDPGVGKSEIALALIERGHSLVADDITVLRFDGTGGVVASAVPITRYHMEIRGLGIIHVPSLFGVASMRSEMRLDLIIRLHRPAPGQDDIDRTGLNPQTRNVLGVAIPYVKVPIAAGRDLTHVVEVAALNQKLKQLGHDAAKELDDKLKTILSQGEAR